MRFRNENLGHQHINSWQNNATSSFKVWTFVHHGTQLHHKGELLTSHPLLPLLSMFCATTSFPLKTCMKASLETKLPTCEINNLRYPTLPRDAAKNAVQLLHAHEVLVEIGGQRSHLPGIGVQHHCVEVEATSLKEAGINAFIKTFQNLMNLRFCSYLVIDDNQVVAMWHRAASRANSHLPPSQFAAHRVNKTVYSSQDHTGVFLKGLHSLQAECSFSASQAQ